MTCQRIKTQIFSGMLALCLVGSLAQISDAKTAYTKVYDAETGQSYYVPTKNLQARTTKEKIRDSLSDPVVKNAAIGAGLGAAASLLTPETGLLKGAGVGALVGAGTGLADKSQTLQENPGLKQTVKGAAIGTGVGIISGKGALKGAAVGGGAGLGLHLLQKYLDE